jgi:hypothetical protein
MRKGTSICFNPGSDMPDTDTRELTWLLLDRRADPTPALQVAEDFEYPRFAKFVEEWIAQRDWGGAKQGWWSQLLCTVANSSLGRYFLKVERIVNHLPKRRIDKIWAQISNRYPCRYSKTKCRYSPNAEIMLYNN